MNALIAMSDTDPQMAADLLTREYCANHPEIGFFFAKIVEGGPRSDDGERSRNPVFSFSHYKVTAIAARKKTQSSTLTVREGKKVLGTLRQDPEGRMSCELPDADSNWRESFGRGLKAIASVALDEVGHLMQRNPKPHGRLTGAY
ncbi:hypothetical protein ACEUZ9_000292 [Paracoccus litorisediminis]|uniref:hypothetical protein n=1 Tax=Paracoccus litorisediminis TaxID=2006130 RepID=UPI00372F4F41